MLAMAPISLYLHPPTTFAIAALNRVRQLSLSFQGFSLKSAVGHWIQLCPTNLDPSYDKPPDPSYRCELCGQVGSHFATLCPRNENEISLTKKRQRIASGSEPPLWRGYYQGRSASPMDGYRQGGHDIYRPDHSPRARYDEPTRHARRPEYGRELSPYSERVRLTRERERERGRDLRKPSPRRSTRGSYRPLGRSSSPLRRRRDSKTSSVRSPRLMTDSDRSRDGESREGRLAYDDEIDVFMEPCLSLQASMGEDALEPTEDINKGASMNNVSPIMDGTSEDIERAKREADAFLDALGIEIMASKKSCAVDDPMSIDDIHSVIDGCDTLDEPKTPIFEKPNGGKIRRVDNPQLQEEVDILLAGRDNHVVHSRASRKRTCEMIDAL
ncbi:hypothetical protein F4775DRAFT_321684 [Biscogniauxia sp. FL1348]|nr:hypothetical protein F4775DRAFT_321684 [Biscogniauxia sp. FL1348]